MAEFTMPSLGADMDEGTVVEWLVKPGDQVHRGDIVAVIDTAKSAVEVECFVSGTVERLVVPVGQTVPVGTVPAFIASEEPVAAAAQPVTGPPTPPSPRRPGVVRPAASPLLRKLATRLGVDLTTVRGSGASGALTRKDIERAAAAPRRRRATSPHARRLAKDLGVDLDEVRGTGRDGAVQAEDVKAAAARVAQPAAAEDRAAAMRQAIAVLMARSKREIPHYYLTTTVDMGNAVRWMQEHNRDLPVLQRIVTAALMLKATAVAAQQVPQLNGFWVDDHFVPGGGGAHWGRYLAPPRWACRPRHSRRGQSPN